MKKKKVVLGESLIFLEINKFKGNSLKNAGNDYVGCQVDLVP